MSYNFEFKALALKYDNGYTCYVTMSHEQAEEVMRHSLKEQGLDLTNFHASI